jgi:hypothetical protein
LIVSPQERMKFLGKEDGMIAVAVDILLRQLVML